jgi:hypothetical protein
MYLCGSHVLLVLVGVKGVYSSRPCRLHVPSATHVARWWNHHCDNCWPEYCWTVARLWQCEGRPDGPPFRWQPSNPRRLSTTIKSHSTTGAQLATVTHTLFFCQSHTLTHAQQYWPVASSSTSSHTRAINLHTRIYTRTYAHAHIHAHLDAYTYAHIHTHTHTHTGPLPAAV